MISYKVDEISPDSTFLSDVLLDKEFLLIPANCSFNEVQLKDIKAWNFVTVYSETQAKTKAEMEAIAEEAKKEAAAKITIVAKPADVDAKMETVDVNNFFNGDNAKDPVTATKAPEQKTAAVSKPDATAVKNAVSTEEKQKAKTAEMLHIDSAVYNRVKNDYHAYMSYIHSVYTQYATNKVFNNDEIQQKVTELCALIKENKSYILRIMSTPESMDKNFLVSHGMRSTIVALTIGLQLRLPEDKLVELGVACILHEIGMILLPPQIYMADKPLSPPEKLMMNTHPIVSFNILKRGNFSLPIQIAVLQHHERMNGTGYPKHLEGDKISLYARILAIACSYEAITAPREYKEERTTFEALIEMLRNSNRQYDDTVTKALLYSISLYPIGVYVYLSNGKIAQVVDVIPGQPKMPYVQLLGETEEDGSPKIMQVDATNIRIIRVLNKKEVEDTLKALRKSTT